MSDLLKKEQILFRGIACQIQSRRLESDYGIIIYVLVTICSGKYSHLLQG